MISALEQLRKIRARKEAEVPVETTKKEVREPKEPLKPKMSLHEALKVFGHKEFRPGQEEVVRAVVEGTKGVLAVFPTGHGKSLIYQLPSLLSDRLTLVVSPLIALMKDQVDALQKLNVNAILINSTLSEQETQLALAEVSSGGVTALYVSPERFANPQFSKVIKKLDIDILAVDEAHCFIGDTLVTTPTGICPISSIQVGDDVVSYEDGKPTIRKVSGLSLHRGLDVWKVCVNGRDIYCDGGQKFFVENTGFVSVDKIQCGHEIIIEKTEDSLRGMRDGQVYATEEEQTAEQVLFKEVPEDRVGQDEEGGNGGENLSSMQQEVSDKAGIQDDTLLDSMRSEVGEEANTIIEENASAQSNERSECAKCGIDGCEGNRQIQESSRGQREGSDESRKDTGFSWPIQDKSNSQDGTLQGREWLSDALQTGLVVAVHESNRGSGREVARVSEGEGSRSAQGVVFETARVESVSCVERGSILSTGECLGENKAGVLLYDIEVEGSHNFFANGSLVHNCISRWGHDFRPSYSQLGGVIEQLNPRQVVALTATATEKVRDDVCNILGIVDAQKFVRGVCRPNLHLAAVQSTGIDRMNDIALVVKEHRDLGSNTGIIYTATKKEAESICEFLKLSGIEAAFYHAGLTDKKRSEIQNNWSENGGVIAATCAFGMGIDKADVRFVIHSGLSQSIEDWYQEIGRAGRDGEESLCITFYDYKSDYRTQMFLIELTNPSGKDIEGFWSWIEEDARREAKPGEVKVQLNMTQKVMSAESGCVNVGACISFLKKKGLVKTLGRGKYEVTLDKEADFSVSEVDTIRKERIDKLNEVTNFYRSKDCRAAYVCSYFGDDTFEGSCGVCDNCD